MRFISTLFVSFTVLGAVAGSSAMDIAGADAEDVCSLINPGSRCVDGVNCSDLYWISADSTYYMLDLLHVLQGAPVANRVTCHEAATMFENPHAVQYDFNVEAYEAKLATLQRLVGTDLMGSLLRFPLEGAEQMPRTMQAMQALLGALQVTAELSEETAAANRALVRSVEFTVFVTLVEEKATGLTMTPFRPHSEAMERIAPFLWVIQDMVAAVDPSFRVGTRWPSPGAVGDLIMARYPPVYRMPGFVFFSPEKVTALQPVAMLGANDPQGATHCMESVRRMVQSANDIFERRRQTPLGRQLAPANATTTKEIQDNFTNLVRMLSMNFENLGVDPASLAHAHEALLLLRFRNIACPFVSRIAYHYQWMETFLPAISYPLANHVLASLAGLCQLSPESRVELSVMAPGRLLAAGEVDSWRRQRQLALPRNEAEALIASRAFLVSGAERHFRYDLVVALDDVGQVGYVGPRKQWIDQMLNEFKNVTGVTSAFEYSTADETAIRLGDSAQGTPEDKAARLANIRATGRVLGYALRYGVQAGLRCSASFVKQLALAANPATPVDYDALIAEEDAGLLAHINGMARPDMAYMLEDMDFGDLLAGGESITVTAENLALWQQLRKQQRVYGQSSKALTILVRGMADVVGAGVFQMLGETELQERLCARPGGLTNELMKAGFVRRNFNPANEVHANISRWLDEMIDEMTPEQLVQFHVFVTGTANPPVVSRDWMKAYPQDLDPTSHPRAHACHNELQIPPYASKEIMVQKFLFAITESGSIEGHADYQVVAAPANA